MANQGWNGSTLSFGGGVTPLTDLHQPNDPAKFDTTGSTDSTHTHGAGLPETRLRRASSAASVPSPAHARNHRGHRPHGQSDHQDLSPGRAHADVDQRPEGRPDRRQPDGHAGRHEPHGHHEHMDHRQQSRLQWLYVLLVGHGPGRHHLGQLHLKRHSDRDRRRKRQRQPARSRHSRRSITITVLGNPGLVAKAIGATVMSWKDGGSLGSWTHAKLMSTHSGGSLDGQVTTELVFKPILSTTTATG